MAKTKRNCTRKPIVIKSKRGKVVAKFTGRTAGRGECGEKTTGINSPAAKKVQARLKAAAKACKKAGLAPKGKFLTGAKRLAFTQCVAEKVGK